MTTKVLKPEGTARGQQPSNGPVRSDETTDTIKSRRPPRVRLSPEETRARMEAFPLEREEAFVAAIREDED